MGRRWVQPAAVLLSALALASASASAQEGGLPPAGSSVADIPDISIANIPDIEPNAIAEPVAEGAIPLFLSVLINGRETDLIAEFSLSREGRVSSVSSELEEIGLRAPGRGNRQVFLDTLDGVSYRYDEAQQVIEFDATPDAQIPREIRGRPTSEVVEPQPGYGAVLNYRITGNLGDNLLEDGFRLKSFYAPIEARLYAPIGVLTTTGQVSAAAPDFDDTRFQRYDTQFVYSSPHRLLTFTAGDTISSSLPWTRPVRMGGLQLRRDFSLRSGIVTSPLLSLPGVATVPSTIDLYVDNVRAWSGETDPGPFVVTELPLINSRGEAVFVLRDEAGNETVTTVPFFATRDLLARGQLDFSMEAGWVREDIGISDFAYGDDAMVSATFRYGTTDRLTFQGHLEYTTDLISGSTGFTTVLFNRAEIGVAAGASRYGDATGHIGHMNVRTEIAGADVRLSTTRTFGEFSDLAYATGLAHVGANASETDLERLRPSRAQDALSVSLPIGDAQFGLSYIHSDRGDTEVSIVSASYSNGLPWKDDASLHVNAFHDVLTGETGAAVAITVPLGKRTTARASISRDRTGDLRATAAADRRLDREVGSYGYLGEISVGENDSFSGRGSASYRSRFGVAEAGLRYDVSSSRAAASASFEGAIVAAGGGVFASNRIADAFAVVDVGVADVPVELHNRTIARTGPSGRALVPDLQSYRNNRISIDPSNLPLNATLDATATNVVPARRSGVAVTLGGNVGSSALVVLRTGSGDFVETGSHAVLNAEGEAIPVGYDGEIWLEDLRSRNSLLVETSRGTCTATFAFEPTPDDIVVIDPVECL